MTTYLKNISILLILITCACKGGNNSSGNNSNTQQNDIKNFSIPQLPTTLTTPEEKQDFIANHYWDNMNFADTSIIHYPDITEQAWADYCNILGNIPSGIAQNGIRTVIRKTEADKKVFNYFADLADKYLYDPNSPMRNEELYIPVLETIIASPVLNDTEKKRYQARLELAQKNRPGTQAFDIAYTLASGATGTLHQLQSEYTILFINNPGCEACRETVEGLKSSATIDGLVKNKKLKILAIYPDEELNEWRKYSYEFPKEWIYSYDKEFIIKKKNLYDLKAIPTLYLLDKNKTVLLKDAPWQSIDEYLYTHS